MVQVGQDQSDKPKLDKKARLKLKAEQLQQIKEQSKLSHKEHRERLAEAASISGRPAGEQAEFLWEHFRRATAASSLEREGLTADSIQELPGAGSLEDRLKACFPGSWERDLGGKGREGETSRINPEHRSHMRGLTCSTHAQACAAGPRCFS